MKIQKCPFCGSSRTTRSPSGEHLLCVQCQRILIVPRPKAPPPEMSEEAKEPEAEKKTVAGAGS